MRDENDLDKYKAPTNNPAISYCRQMRSFYRLKDFFSSAGTP